VRDDVALSAARATEPESRADRLDGRLSLAVLAAAAALVLAAGAAWWVAADPERQAEPVQTTPPVVVPEQPVVPEAQDNDPDSYLPNFPNTVERQVGRIDPDGSYILHVTSVKDSEYRLQYVCLGPGDLSVRIMGTTEGEMLYQVNCEGNLSTFQFVAADTRVVIEVHRPGPEPADVGIQVIDVQ
jgi:hypothetical protein